MGDRFAPFSWVQIFAVTPVTFVTLPINVYKNIYFFSLVLSKPRYRRYRRYRPPTRKKSQLQQRDLLAVAPAFFPDEGADGLH